MPLPAKRADPIRIALHKVVKDVLAFSDIEALKLEPIDDLVTKPIQGFPMA